MKNLKLLAGLAGAALLNFGCPARDDGDGGDAPAARGLTASEAALIANNNIEAHLVELADSIKVLEDSELLEGAFPKSTTVCAPGQPDCTAGTTTSDLDMRDEADDLTDWLRDHVFAASNVESSTDTTVVFRLQPQSMCPETEDGTGAIARDPECVEFFTDVPVRFTATSLAANDLNLRLDIGASHPADFELHQSHLSVQTDLAEIRKAIEIIADETDQDLEAFPDTFVGVFKLALNKEAALKYNATFSVVSAIRVAMNDATSNKYLDVAVAPAADALKWRIDAGAKAMFASVDFKNIDVKAALHLLAGQDPYEECDRPSDPNVPPTCHTVTPEPKTGVVEAHLGGLSATTDFNVSADTFALSNLGLGADTSTIKYNGAQILGLDINKDHGRKFALNVAHANDKTTVSVTPAFAARLAHDLRTIEAQLGDDVPAWALNGFAEVKFDGAASPTFEIKDRVEQPPCEPSTGTNCDPVESAPVYPKLTAGTLTLSAHNISSISISSPQCVRQNAAAEGQTFDHPFQELKGGACE